MNDDRERLIAIAREVEELSQPKLPRPAYFRELLRRLVSATSAHAAVVWVIDPSNRIGRLCDVAYAPLQLESNPQQMQLNQKLLVEAFNSGKAQLYDPGTYDQGLPTEHLLVLIPVQKGEQVVGAIELFLSPEIPANAHKGLLQYLEQVAGHSSKYLAHETLPGEVATGDVAFWEPFEQLVLQMQRTLAVREVASIAVNDTRALLRCDQVGLAVQYGRQTVIEAVSGQDSVDRRAEKVVRLRRLVGTVLKGNEQLVYGDKETTFAPAVEKALTQYLELSGARWLLIRPLYPSEPVLKHEETATRRKEVNKKPIGALIVELVKDIESAGALPPRIELIADHVAAGLHNARQHESIFLLPLWRTIGSTLDWLRGRRLLQAAAIAVTAVVVGVALVVVPWDYRVQAEGRLMPKIQRNVFAPWDGEVVEIPVLERSDRRVKKGDPLIVLHNNELHAQLLGTRSRLEEQIQLVDALEAERDQLLPTNRNMYEQEKVRLEGKIAEARIEIDSAREQLEILETRTAQLTCRAPFDGVVVTFQLEQLLDDRPVRRGELLVEVMDDAGPWRLELEVEEHRMGHLLAARNAWQADHGDGSLPIDFVLATSTETTFHGHLTEIATRSNSGEEQGTIVEVIADLSPEEQSKLPTLRIGAETRAKIYCGQKSLGYVLFGDVIEFCRKHLWRWL